MTPRTETVAITHLLCDDAPPVITGPVAESLIRSLHLMDRPRDLRAERNYADSVASGYVTLPAGCSIPAPAPTSDELNSQWAGFETGVTRNG
ncbi:hypothetical protein [Streptomyces sp. NPDC086838]|uniref:hypothetical protein n=1 Tax=Streptomyces sp. NPDC086838 TaxID=3365762 RepID=UPI0037FAF904